MRVFNRSQSSHREKPIAAAIGILIVLRCSLVKQMQRPGLLAVLYMMHAANVGSSGRCAQSKSVRECLWNTWPKEEGHRMIKQPWSSDSETDGRQ